MVIERLRSKEGLTEGESLVADYVLAHADEAQRLSAADLAERSLASKATVIRLCQKLGMSGYSEFRLELAHEWQEYRRVQALLSEEPFNARSGYADIVETLPTIYEKAIVRTKLSFDEGSMQLAIDHLRAADRIEIYGEGITNTVAQTAAFKFLSVGVEASAYDGINEHHTIFDRGRVVTCAIVLSFTGGNAGMVHAATFLRENGIFVIGVGGTESSLLAGACDVYVPVSSTRLVMTMEAVSSVAGTSYVLDVFFASLMVDRYEENLDAALEVMRMHEPHPVGTSPSNATDVTRTVGPNPDRRKG